MEFEKTRLTKQVSHTQLGSRIMFGTIRYFGNEEINMLLNGRRKLIFFALLNRKPKNKFFGFSSDT